MSISINAAASDLGVASYGCNVWGWGVERSSLGSGGRCPLLLGDWKALVREELGGKMWNDFLPT